jgi:acetoin:2,6-dichlorophenolindophenol oxidoreductase subunit alpha
VLFICENNLYMEYTPISSVTAVAQPAAGRAPAYGLPAEVVDGNDVVTVMQAASRAAARARAGDGPTVIEALTYRQYGHSRADPAKYRPKEEVDAWMRRDPLIILAERLEASGVERKAIDERRDRADELVAAAVEAAKAAPPADESTALTDLWADGGAQWRT